MTTRTAPQLTGRDRTLITRARELPPDVTMDTLRRVTGLPAGASDEMVLRDAVGVFAYLLGEVTDRLEQLGDGNDYRWWITTGWLDGRPGIEKVLGPFESKELALAVRTFVEKVTAPGTYFVDAEKSDD
jgi:hypothetical protein